MRVINITDWGNLSPEEKNKSLEEFQKPYSASEEQALRKEVKGQLAAYEAKFGMTLSELKEKLKSGEVKETFEMCCWMMLDNC